MLLYCFCCCFAPLFSVFAFFSKHFASSSFQFSQSFVLVVSSSMIVVEGASCLLPLGIVYRAVVVSVDRCLGPSNNLSTIYCLLELFFQR